MAKQPGICQTVERDAPVLKNSGRAPTQPDVDQVSPPMRIALGAVLVFAALWFVALKPKPVEEVASDPAPATQSAAPAADAAPADSSTPDASAAPAKAEPAKADPAAPAKSEAKAEKAEAKTSTKTSTKAKNGADRVLADLDAGRTVVLLVWDGKSADDRSVRRAVARVDRHGGKVRTHVVPLSKLSGYEAITRGVPISESPTVLVIDAERQARVISGLTVKGEIDDAVDRALKVK